MTFGRPPSIPNDYIQMALPLELDLETIDVPNDVVPDGFSYQSPSTVAVYIHSM